MTIQKLYDWAKENNALNDEIFYDIAPSGVTPILIETGEPVVVDADEFGQLFNFFTENYTFWFGNNKVVMF